MSYRISILDKSPLAAGETAAQALARTLTLAQHAEAWGYHRFWVAEHHNTDQLASPRRSWLSPGCWATPGGSVLGPAASCSSTIAPIRSRKTLTCWPPSRRAASISGSARRLAACRSPPAPCSRACIKRRKGPLPISWRSWITGCRRLSPGRGEPTRHADPAAPGRRFSARRQPGEC